MKKTKTKPVSDLGAAAAALGRLGGRAGTPKQDAARRRNGRKGGRPKKALDNRNAPV